MLELFDGFIAAVSTETKIPFRKEADGQYAATIDFEGGRKQKVLVTLDQDDAGDAMISYFSIIAKNIRDELRLYKEALEVNVSLTYGAIGLMDGSFVIRQSYYLSNLDPQRFMKSLLYVAAKADELEEVLDPKQDKY